MNCKNCNQDVSGNYCGNCGTPAVLKRVNGHYILHEIQHILHFEKGILYTIKALLLQPGKSIRTFISEDRSRLVKPVIFIIVTSLVYTIIAHFFHTGRDHVNPGTAAHSATATIMSWIESHYGYANIIMGIFIGFLLKIMSRKNSYNFFEILIMLCFVMGTGMLLFAAFTLISGLSGKDLTLETTIVSLAYCVWAIGQFLNSKKAASYLVAFAAYVLGMLLFFLSVNALGYLIDTLRKV
jgi:hypothetical protein